MPAAMMSVWAMRLLGLEQSNLAATVDMWSYAGAQPVMLGWKKPYFAHALWMQAAS